MGGSSPTKRRRYSVLSLARNAFAGGGDVPVWRNPEPKPVYDVAIVGGGGHGLATAYYLAKNHGITNVAVLEKGWLGGGNSGRNTQTIRSNYLHPESARFYEFSLRLYEGLSQELNYNIMLSQRGFLTLAHSRHDLQFYTRWANAMQVNGIDSEILSVDQLRKAVPLLNFSAKARFPVRGGFNQARAGIARHDAVNWGYARAADAAGVDILQQCEVTAIRREGQRAVSLETSRGTIRAKKIGIAVAGHASAIAEMAGFRIPIESCALQAFVSDPVKPVLDTIVISPTVHVYVHQTDKGEIVAGGGTDSYNSYAQRGSFPPVEHTVQALIELFPAFSRLRMMRQWAGIVDISPDRSPIVSATPLDNVFLSCGWGTGGFKAIPAGGWTFAHLIATGAPHRLIAPFGLERFVTGALIDEGAASGVAH